MIPAAVKIDTGSKAPERGFAWYASGFLIAALLVAGLYGLTLEWVRPTETVRSAKLGTSSNASAPVTIAWGVNDNLVREGGELGLWFQFVNNSTANTNVAFADFHAPGFVRRGDCWNGWPKCMTGNQRFEGRATLQRGESILMNGNLLAHEAGRYNLTVIYSWTNSAGSEVRAAALLGPVEVASDFQMWVSNLFGRMAGFILPLSLALAGAGLQLLQKKYDDSRRAADDERARAAAVLNTLLPTQMTDTKVLYLPMVSKVNMVVRAHEKWQAEPGNIELGNEVAFSVAMFWRHQRLLIDQQGGFHLQHRAGEKLVRECFNTFKTHLQARVGKPALAPAGRLRRRLDFDEFMTKPALDQLRAAVSDWLTDLAAPLGAEIPTLKILRTVLGVEINRPFERWYGNEPLDFPVDVLTELRGQVPTQEIGRIFDDYLAQNRS